MSNHSREAGKEQLVGLTLAELEQRARAAGEPAYRGRQLFHALYHERQTDIARMTALPAALRERLGGQYEAGLPGVERDFHSADHTTRYLLRLADGRRVETVVMPVVRNMPLPSIEGERPRRTTFCVSTQAGCAVDCKFCLTGALGFFRNLTAGEIVGQVLLAMDRSGEAEAAEDVEQAGETRGPARLNLVFMGQGEPLLNYDNVMAAFRILADPRGVGIPASRITLSTAGVVPGIERLGGETHRPRLAISLNAPNDGIRSAIMPINKKWPISELLRACQGFPLRPGEKITFEYVLLAGVNDSLGHARELARLVKQLPCKVNLIGWNPGPELGFKTTADEDIRAFQSELRERGIANYLRLPRGRDIYAACGQLSLASQGAG